MKSLIGSLVSSYCSAQHAVLKEDHKKSFYLYPAIFIMGISIGILITIFFVPMSTLAFYFMNLSLLGVIISLILGVKAYYLACLVEEKSNAEISAWNNLVEVLEITPQNKDSNAKHAE